MKSNQPLKEFVTSVVQRAKMKFESRAVVDILQAINGFKDLKPLFTQHQSPDGVQRWCVSLSGTIPINYKGLYYHIPVALYFMENHPYSGPFCYVCPTSTMRIRVSETVDEKGRIYLPYLTEWRFPGYDTYGLLLVMTIAFQEKSPMYSISSKVPPNSNAYTTPYPGFSIPYPVGQNTISPTLPLLPITSKPSLATPYPNVQQSSHSQLYPAMGSGYKPPYQPPYQPFGGATSIPAVTDMPKPSLTGAMPQPIKNNGSYGYGTIQSSHIRASLISAVEDKIRNRLREKIGNPFAELQSIDVNLQELRNGEQKLKNMLESIDADQAQLELIISTYKDKKLELEQALELQKTTSNKGETTIDDAIDATTPLHRQIFRCYAEDSAIDDTIYFLGQALKKSIINIQTYLKYVRQLSRKQFVYRATIQKCRLKANLAI